MLNITQAINQSKNQSRLFKSFCLHEDCFTEVLNSMSHIYHKKIQLSFHFVANSVAKGVATYCRKQDPLMTTVISSHIGHRGATSHILMSICKSHLWWQCAWNKSMCLAKNLVHTYTRRCLNKTWFNANWCGIMNIKMHQQHYGRSWGACCKTRKVKGEMISIWLYYNQMRQHRLKAKC